MQEGETIDTNNLSGVHIYSPIPKDQKGRPKKDGEIKKWDIRLTPDRSGRGRFQFVKFGGF